MADERIVLDGDASALVAAFKEAKAEAEATRKRIAGLSAEFDGLGEDADDARKSVERLAKQMQKTALDNALKKALGANAKETNKFAVEAERMNRVSQMLGGTFGDLTGGLDDFATLMTGGAGAVTAFGAAAVVSVASAAALAVGIVSVVASTDEYVASMSKMQRDKWAEQIDAATEAQDAFEGLSEVARNFAFLTSAEFAPALQYTADAMTGAISLAIEYEDELSSMFSTITTGLNVALLPFTPALKAVGFVMGQLTDDTAEYGKAQREANASQREAEQLAQDYITALDAIDEAIINKSTRDARQWELDFYEDARKANAKYEADQRKAAAAAAKRAQEAARQARERLQLAKEEHATWLETQKLLKEHHEQVAQINGVLTANQEQALAATEATKGLNIEQLAGMTAAVDGLGDQNAAIAETKQNDQKMTDKRIQNAQLWVSITAQAADAVGGLLTWVADHSMKEERKAAKVRLAGQLLQAIAGTALAVVNGLATAPIVPVGIAMAAAAGIAGAVQIGTIAAQQGKLHRGGYAPDEMSQGGMNVLREERMVVLTEQAQRQIGGEDGTARLNAGMQASNTDGATFILDGKRYTKRRLAAPDPGYGQWSPA